MTHEYIQRNVEFRAADTSDSDGRNLEGYAAVFGADTEINSWEGRFTETIVPGAFRKTLRERKGKIMMQWNHGGDSRVGHTPIGHYTELVEDDHGLKVKGRLFDNDLVEPIRQAIEAGAVTGMSFKFRVLRDDWHDVAGKRVKPDDLYQLLYDAGERGPLRRSIKEIQLFEAGPVSTPAYDQTSVGVRSDEGKEQREALVEQYRQSVLAEEAEVRAVSEWLEAEERYNTELWLSAEWLHAERCWLWLEAERKDSEKPYGDVTYADPGYQKDKKKRYPLDTKEHVKAAWSYINMPKNQSAYTSAQVSSIKSKIRAAAKKFGIEIDSEKKSASDSDAVRKDTSRPAGSAPVKKPTRVVTSKRASNEKPTDTRKVRAMNIHELRAREDELRSAIEGLEVEYRDAEMPDAEAADFTAFADELDDVRSKIEAIEARAERMKGYAAKAPASQRENANQSAAFHKERDVFDVEATRAESRSPEDFSLRLRDDAKRAIDKARFANVTSRTAAQERATELLDLHSDSDDLAKRILITGSPVYERAFSKAMRDGSLMKLDQEEYRAMTLGGGSPVGEQGGFAVPYQLDPTVILTNDGYVGSLRNVARVETITGKEWQGVTSAGISVSRDGSPAAGEIGRTTEAAEASDGSFELAQPTVKATRVQGFVPFTYEIDQDWGGLRSEITRMLNDAKDREEMESFTLGDGTNQQPLGFVEGGTAVAPSVAEAFNAAELYRLETLLAPRWRQNGTFMANRAIYNLIRQIDTAGGAQLWERIGNGLPSQLLGYAAHENSYMDAVHDPAVTATSSKILAFGDFKQFLIVDRIGMSVELIPQVFGASGRPTGQRGIYAIWRNNATVLVPAAIKVLNVATTA
jgi:HK97 family phage major capsid protein/HK97 family phage prohead protease